MEEGRMSSWLEDLIDAGGDSPNIVSVSRWRMEIGWRNKATSLVVRLPMSKRAAKRWTQLVACVGRRRAIEDLGLVAQYPFVADDGKCEPPAAWLDTLTPLAIASIALDQLCGKLGWDGPDGYGECSDLDSMHTYPQTRAHLSEMVEWLSVEADSEPTEKRYTAAAPLWRAWLRAALALDAGEMRRCARAVVRGEAKLKASESAREGIPSSDSASLDP